MKNTSYIFVILLFVQVTFSKNSLDSLDVRLKKAESIGDTNEMITAIAKIADIYNVQGDYKSSDKELCRAYILAKKSNDKAWMTDILNSRGVIRSQQHQIDSALFYYQAAYNMQFTEDTIMTAVLLNNIGYIYYNKNNYAKALEMFKIGIKLSETLSDTASMTNGYCDLSRIYYAKKYYKKSEMFALKSMKLAKGLKKLSYTRNAAEVLKNIYTATGNCKKALEFTNLYYQTRDSIKNDETQREMVRHQLAFEFAKKAATDSLKNDEEKRIASTKIALQESKLNEEKTMRYALYGGIMLVAGFLVFVFYRFRVAKRQKAIIEAQKKQVDQAYEKLHEKNQEVIASIRYAKRIQVALLTSERYINRNLNKLNSL